MERDSSHDSFNLNEANNNIVLGKRKQKRIMRKIKRRAISTLDDSDHGPTSPSSSESSSSADDEKIYHTLAQAAAANRVDLMARFIDEGKIMSLKLWSVVFKENVP